MPSQSDYARLRQESEAYSAVQGERRIRNGVSMVAIAAVSVAIGGLIAWTLLGRGNRIGQDANFETTPYDPPQLQAEPPKPVVDNSRIQLPLPPAPAATDGKISPSLPAQPGGLVGTPQTPQAATAPMAPPAPPEVTVPAAPFAATSAPGQPPQIDIQKQEEAKRAVETKAKAENDARWARLRANSIVNDASNASEKPAVDPAKMAADAADKEGDPNLSFLNSHGKQKVQIEKAEKIERTDALVAAGTMIHAVLETAIQSDLAGSIRAVTSEDVYSFDGRRILIPAGTRLIGEYKSGVKTGQVRVFVIWTRALTPDGTSISLASTGTDALGRGGMTGDVDNHYAERFGAATALSFIGAGASFLSGWGFGAGGQSSQSQTTVTNPDGSTTTITSNNLEVQARQKAADATSQSLTKMAEDTLQEYIKIPPTIHVDQGEPVIAFVRRDLDFSDLYPDPVIEAMRKIRSERRAAALPQ